MISTYCVGCHPSPGSSSIPNLTTLAAIQSEVRNYPGRLIGSIERTAPYNTTTQAMPQGGAKLPDCYIKQIKNWVDADMPNN
jgi:mono/diheme cytochrome c family protein